MALNQTFCHGRVIIEQFEPERGIVTRHHWLNDRQFVDAVATITPGPVVITTGFIRLPCPGA